jgi:hypothetical protein
LPQTAAERRHGRHDDGRDGRVGEERNGGADPVPRRSRSEPQHRDEFPVVPETRVVEHCGRAGFADDRDARELVRPGRRGASEQPPFALVCPQDPQPVEDRGRVPQRAEDGERTDAGAREAIVEPHRQLADPAESERPCDGEQLQVEREPLHQHERQHLVGDAPAEDLEAHLRVPHVEAEK